MKGTLVLIPGFLAVLALGSALVALATIGGCAPVAEAPPAAPEAKPAPTPTPEPFYEGKTIRVIVGFAPGSGFDVWARIIARHIPKYIPGKPTMVVENMAGAGSMIAANYVYKAVKPDGLTIGTFIGVLGLQQLLKAEGVEFDFTKFNWLGTPEQSIIACGFRADKLKSIEDALAREIVVGATGPGTVTWDFPKALNFALGTKFKVVGGYPGLAPALAAAEKGEVDGGCATWASIKVTWKDLIERKEVVIPVQQGPKRHPELPAVPIATDLAKTEEGKQIIRLVAEPAVMTFGYATTPGVPEERVKTLQQAFAQALKDPELLEETKKAKLEVDPLTPKEVLEISKRVLATPSEVVARLKTILE